MAPDELSSARVTVVPVPETEENPMDSILYLGGVKVMVWVPGPAVAGLKVLPDIPGPEKVPDGLPESETEPSDTHIVAGNPVKDCA